MSAMFVALTVVCVLGASAVMTTAGREGSMAGWASTASSILSSIGQATDGSGNFRQADKVALDRDVDASNANLDFLSSVVRDNAKTTNYEFARIYQEITSLKDEVLTLREKSEPAWASAKVDALRDKVDIVRANVNVMQGALEDLSNATDRDTDRINRRLAKIEDVISIRADVTASIPRQTFPPLPRKRALHALWTAEEIGNGIYTVRGPTGTFEVRIGSYVPGLGRIEAIKNQGGRLRLVTARDRGPTTAAQ